MQTKLTRMNIKKSRKFKNQQGFSILELIIAMVLFLIITGAVYGLLEVGRIDRNRSSRRADILKNARVAIHLIGRDALNSGLGYHKIGGIVPDDYLSSKIKVPVDGDETKDLLTAVVCGNNIFPNNLLTDTTARTDTIAFAFRDLDFNAGNVIELKSVDSPVGQPSIARVQTKSATGAAMTSAYDLYLLESNISQIAVMATATNQTNEITFAPTDPLGINLPLNGTGKNSSLMRACVDSDDEDCTSYSFAALKRFFLVTYKVKEDGTLVRTIYGNNKDALASEQIQEQPLAYNVEDLQFKYVLSNGRVTENPAWGTDNLPGTADDDPKDFNLVRQLTVTIKVQSTEIDEKTGLPERVTLNATFGTRNLEYDAG